MVETFKRLGARVIGLDISQNSIDYARAHFGHCTFYCETMQAFRQRGLQFDFVFTSEVMEHLPGPADFMQTLEAVVRPGGFVYASAPDYSHQRTPWTLSSGTPCARPSTCCFSVPIPSSGCLPITALPFTGILAAKPRPIRCCSDGLPDPCA
jgi:SAM-dependent methyltransferase